MIKEKTVNPLTVIPDEIVATCEFDVKSGLALAIAPGVLVLHNKKMTAMNLVNAITTFSALGADITAKLAKACGFCDNCGDFGKGTPASWAAECDLCAELLDIKKNIRVPDYTHIRWAENPRFGNGKQAIFLRRAPQACQNEALEQDGHRPLECVPDATAFTNYKQACLCG